jgi:hypothetical protein
LTLSAYSDFACVEKPADMDYSLETENISVKMNWYCAFLDTISCSRTL